MKQVPGDEKEDTNNSDKDLVRRLAAVEGFEMVTGDEKEEPFGLDKDQCWVTAENQELKAKVKITFFFFSKILGMI